MGKPTARLDKAGVVGSRPTRPTISRNEPGGLAQLGEHLLCKQGVVGSIPSSSTKCCWLLLYNAQLP